MDKVGFIALVPDEFKLNAALWLEGFLPDELWLLSFYRKYPQEYEACRKYLYEQVNNARVK